MEGASFAHMRNVIQLQSLSKYFCSHESNACIYPQFYNCNIALLAFDWDLHNTVSVGVILCTQVELAINVEELLPCRIRRWLIVGSRKVHLNRKLSLLERMWAVFSEKERFDSSENIAKALNPKLVCYL